MNLIVKKVFLILPLVKKKKKKHSPETHQSDL